MEKAQIIKEVGKKIFRPIGWAQILCVLAVFISPIVWIWHEWDFAWRLFVTGIFGILLAYYLNKLFENIVESIVDKELSKIEKDKPKSKFQHRLEKLAQQSKTGE